MRAIPGDLPAFVEGLEARVKRVYDDARPDFIAKPGDEPVGHWTAGVGHTEPGLHPGMTVTDKLIDKWLASDLSEARARLYAVVDAAVIDDLTENQYKAALDLSFNLGTHDKKTGKVYTVYQVINKRQYDQVPQWIAKYVYSGGKKLNGLVRRRNAEIELWSADEPGSADVTPPSSQVRAAETPPAATDPTPVHKQPGFVASCVTAACTAPAIVGGVVKKASDVIAPYAETSPLIGKAVQHLAEVGAAAALATVAVLYLQHRQAKV